MGENRGKEREREREKVDSILWLYARNDNDFIMGFTNESRERERERESL